MQSSGPSSRRRLSPRHRQSTRDPAATGKQHQRGQSRHAHRPTPASALGLILLTGIFYLPPAPAYPPSFPPQPPSQHQIYLCMRCGISLSTSGSTLETACVPPSHWISLLLSPSEALPSRAYFFKLSCSSFLHTLMHQFNSIPFVHN